MTAIQKSKKSKKEINGNKNKHTQKEQTKECVCYSNATQRHQTQSPNHTAFVTQVTPEMCLSAKNNADSTKTHVKPSERRPARRTSEKDQREDCSLPFLFGSTPRLRTPASAKVLLLVAPCCPLLFFVLISHNVHDECTQLS